MLTKGCVTVHYSLTSQTYQPQCGLQSLRVYVLHALWLIGSKVAGLLRVYGGDYAVAFKS